MPHITCAGTKYPPPPTLSSSLPKTKQTKDPHGDSVFSYCPSYPAAIAFSVLFGIIFLVHLTLASYYRKRFCWVICMGALWETGGFIFRVLNIIHPTSDGLATGSQLLILLSPLWINAFAYMILGRMVYYWIPDKKVWKIKARSLSKWFVWLDICSFIVQGAGGSLLSSTDTKTMNLGIHICKYLLSMTCVDEGELSANNADEKIWAVLECRNSLSSCSSCSQSYSTET